jgi:DNA-binding transcriptional LysR family regulator
MLKSAGISYEDLNVTASISNPGAIIQSVKNGVGITIISRLAAKGEIERGDVLEFPLSRGGFKRSISMVCNSMTPLNESTKKLMRVVKELYLKEKN